MQYRWVHVANDRQQQWLLKRNCALGPRQLAAWFGALSAVSLGIAAGFAVRGAWMVLPFALLECAVLGVAFVVYARHAADYERIVVAPGRLIVERSTGGALDRVEWRPDWVRVEYGGARGDSILLRAGREEVAVGHLVPGERREQLARELNDSLAGWRAWQHIKDTNDSGW